MLNTRKNYLRAIGRGLALFVVALLTFECMARLDDWLHYDAPLTGRYDFEQLFQETGHGVRGIPNGRYLRWRLNADGLHGPDVKAAPENTAGIAFGASEVFGIYEDEGQDFPSQLEKQLNSDSSGHIVLNAGIPGLRIGSGVSLLQELSAKYHPSWIVIYPTPTHYIGVSRPYCGRSPKEKVAVQTSLPTFRIAEKFRELVKRNMPKGLMTIGRRLSIEWRMLNSVPIDRVPDVSLVAFEVDLKCAIHGAKTLGMTIYTITHANRFGPEARPDDSYWLIGWRNQYPELREAGFLELERRANEVIRRVSKEENVELIDAATALSGRSEWFSDHAHFTNVGAGEIAKTVFRTLNSPTISGQYK